MVHHHSSIDPCKSTHNSATGNHVQKKGRTLNSSIQFQPSCDQSQSALIDMVILIAVIGAFGVLLYPCVIFTYVKFREIGDLFMSLVIEEVLEKNPLIYGSLGLGTLCVAAAAWAIVACMSSRKCGNLDCLGLRNAGEFDIQLETEECVRNDGVKRGLFELPRDHHRELEAELRKMAPPNGRAVLVLRARCGCCVGRMEVPGLRKTQKIKKCALLFISTLDFKSSEVDRSRQASSAATTTQILQPHFVRKVVVETIATYLLVFVTCGAGAMSAVDERRVSRLAASVAGGLIVTVMIYAVGHISGAHMNPAVTLAFAAVPWYQVPFYAAAQLTGAISAGFTLRMLLEPIKHVGTTSPSGTQIQALVMEIVVTFSMMFITSAVATDTKAIGELAGIAVGSAVCITSILAGPISGGSMNPARSLGPALASGYYKGIWVYFVGPVTGTLLGAWTYYFIRVSDKPLHVAISPQQSLSFRLRRNESSCINDQETASVTNKEDRHDCC